MTVALHIEGKASGYQPFVELAHVLATVEGFDLDALTARCRDLKDENALVYFIGNGGSAAVASHMAADWTKNGGFGALAFNDPVWLTCISNDLGYDQVFRHGIARHGRPGDMLFAISSSGESRSITSAVEKARQLGVYVVTLSGFAPRNALRALGNENIYIPSQQYGVVEIAHLACLHAILDAVLYLEC